MTVYVMDCEANGLLDEVTYFHCLCFSPLASKQYYVFCDLNVLDSQDRLAFEKQNVSFFPLQSYLQLLTSNKTTGLICHNIFQYDLPVMEKLNGIKFNCNSINNKLLDITDTLVLSRYLMPERRLPNGCPTSVFNTQSKKSDRIGPHGLAAWGYRTGIAKPTVVDWSDQPLSVYINRVIEDVKINKAAYIMLKRESKNVAIPNGSLTGQWDKPLKMCQKVYYLMCLQERTGVPFATSAAERLIVRIDQEMDEICKQIEPTLGQRKLPAGKQPNPPLTSQWKQAFNYKAPWTKTGKLKKSVVDYLISIGFTDAEAQEKYIKTLYSIDEYGDPMNEIAERIIKSPDLLTASAIRYCNKIGITDPVEMIVEFNRLHQGGTPKVLKEKLQLKHKKDVKEFLIRDGWRPTIWRYRNILINLKTKQKLSSEEVDVKYNKYIKEFHNSIYWPFILTDLGYTNLNNVDITTNAFKQRVLHKGRALLAAPQYKDNGGVTCPNLKKLIGETSLEIIKWLSLHHRRTTIKSLTKNTGWLLHPRLKVDGRLPAKASGISNTNRMKHAVVCNVPSVGDNVILGREMRELFIAPDGYLCCGVDASGIEGRCAGNAAYPFDGGAYAEEVLNGDIHLKNSIAFSKAAGREISRSDGKPIYYGSLYGCQAKKAGDMLGASSAVGQAVIDALWTTYPGLKLCIETLEKYWEATDKKYIMGLDGRKIFTRSKHSLLNCYLQSMGAILMDWVCCYIAQQIEIKQFDATRWVFYHDEVNHHIPKDSVKEYFFPLDSKPSEKRDGHYFSKPKLYREGQVLHYLKEKEALSTDQWIQWYSPFGEICVEAMIKAGQYFKLKVPLDGQYIIGDSWATTH